MISIAHKPTLKTIYATTLLHGKLDKQNIMQFIIMCFIK